MFGWIKRKELENKDIVRLTSAIDLLEGKVFNLEYQLKGLRSKLLGAKKRGELDDEETTNLKYNDGFDEIRKINRESKDGE